LLKTAQNRAVCFEQPDVRKFAFIRQRASKDLKMRKPRTNIPTDAKVLAVSPAEAGRLAGIGRTTIYQAISSGDLKSLKIGARRLVTVEALHRWLLDHEVRP